MLKQPPLLTSRTKRDTLNISYAAYKGDLFDKGGIRFFTYVAISSIPYCTFEVPAKVLVQKIRPNAWLSLATVLFGLATMFQGTIQSYGGLLAMRFLLGVFELAMFAGIFYVTGLWYPRWDAVYRHDLFTSFLPFVAAFEALLVAGVDKMMSGFGGYAGWRWVFFFQGGLALVVGFVVFFLLPTLPESSEWLSKDDKEFVASRRSYDPSRCIRTPDMTVDDIGKTFKSFKMILIGVIYICLVIPAYLYANISPTTSKESTYYKVLARIHDIPPWVAPILFGVVIGPFSGFNSWH
ncbi:putative transporter-like protein [Phaeoacremonium minimum UCRPA7]|uniref:Putative transporter-like protein n=1 Tax=Phaeoacremonium minimum (strain UCR-PA7) TaxID=1286976 RepID=R8BF89_PHAM7|nr:putative transporter-like protein [Phaeoacremonium minimum UCRPA7]EON97952.1 putative transporter-like protein [Phaeoacremonium minimum UCRPA7]